ncbi:MAG: hypothetical protein ABUK01_00950 [Leptospirales bacterium]
MYWKPIILVCLALGEGACFYDATPPSESSLNDDRPEVIFTLKGFTPNVKVALRYWSTNSAFAYPRKYQLFTDAQGNYTGSISADNSNTSIAYLIFVDENDNGSWDASDYGAYRSGFTFSSSILVVEDTINYAAGTLGTYTTIEGQPASGVKTCIYNPDTETAWDVSLVDSIVEFPYMEGILLKFEDWLITSEVDSTGATTATFLPSGNYNETCVTDLNSDGYYNGNDNASASTGIIVP